MSNWMADVCLPRDWLCGIIVGCAVRQECGNGSSQDHLADFCACAQHICTHCDVFCACDAFLPEGCVEDTAKSVGCQFFVGLEHKHERLCL